MLKFWLKKCTLYVVIYGKFRGVSNLHTTGDSSLRKETKSIISWTQAAVNSVAFIPICVFTPSHQNMLRVLVNSHRRTYTLYVTRRRCMKDAACWCENALATKRKQVETGVLTALRGLVWKGFCASLFFWLWLKILPSAGGWGAWASLLLNFNWSTNWPIRRAESPERIEM